MNGLRLRYEVDGRMHEFVVRFFFGLCGTDTKIPAC